MVDIAAGSVAFDMAAVCSHVALPAAEQHSLLVQNEFLQARSSWSKPELDPWDQGITTCPGTDLSDVPTSRRPRSHTVQGCGLRRIPICSKDSA